MNKKLSMEERYPQAFALIEQYILQNNLSAFAATALRWMTKKNLTDFSKAYDEAERNGTLEEFKRDNPI